MNCSQKSYPKCSLIQDLPVRIIMKTLSEDRIAAVESAEVIFESAAFLAVFFFLFKICILLSSFLSFQKMHKIATLSHT